MALNRHNDANLILHKLVFISAIGLNASDPDLGKIIQRILEHQSK